MSMNRKNDPMSWAEELACLLVLFSASTRSATDHLHIDLEAWQLARGVDPQEVAGTKEAQRAVQCVIGGGVRVVFSWAGAGRTRMFVEDGQ